MASSGNQNRKVLATLISVVLCLYNSNNAFAATEVFNSLSTGCVTAYTNGIIHTNRFVVNSTSNISAINSYIGSNPQTNFSSARIYIMSDSATVNLPDQVLATFTPDTITGTGTTTTARFIGSYTVNANTKFWLVPAQLASTFGNCYWNPTSTSQFTNGAIAVDTSTSNSTSLWRRALSYSTSPINAVWTATVDQSFLWQYSIEAGSLTYVSVTSGLANGSKVATYRLVNSLQATVDTQSRVTFYANGKVIAGCRNILSSAGIASCNWKPSLHGSYRVYARALPVSGSFIAANSAIANIDVISRVNNR